MSESLVIERLAYSFDQRFDIPVKMKSAHLNCFAARERLQGVRQLAHLRHARPINENGYDRNIVGKRRSDFDRNEVVEDCGFRRCPASSLASSQRGPMTVRNTWHIGT